jgi:hypothetical protein
MLHLERSSNVESSCLRDMWSIMGFPKVDSLKEEHVGVDIGVDICVEQAVAFEGRCLTASSTSGRQLSGYKE